MSMLLATIADPAQRALAAQQITQATDPGPAPPAAVPDPIEALEKLQELRTPRHPLDRPARRHRMGP
jgi:hypothetical protein